jgi:hypothetical protein
VRSHHHRQHRAGWYLLALPLPALQGPSRRCLTFHHPRSGSRPPDNWVRAFRRKFLIISHLRVSFSTIPKPLVTKHLCETQFSKVSSFPGGRPPPWLVVASSWPQALRQRILISCAAWASRHQHAPPGSIWPLFPRPGASATATPKQAPLAEPRLLWGPSIAALTIQRFPVAEPRYTAAVPAERALPFLASVAPATPSQPGGMHRWHFQERPHDEHQLRHSRL